MLEKNYLIKILIVITIFLIGFSIRLDSTNLNSISPEEQGYYRDEYNNPYMYEIDSYYHYRLAYNYIKTGSMGDTIINGQEWDLKSYYPPGRVVDYPPLIIFLTVLIFSIINFFTSVPLIIVCFWLPIIIAPISGIIAYFIVRKFTNEWGGLIAGVLTVSSPYYFLRTVPGWFDTDMFILLFPFITIYFLFEAVLTDNTNKKIIFSSLSSISMLLFAFAWMGWFYLLYLISFSFLIYLAIAKISNKKVEHVLVISIFFTCIPLILIFKSLSNSDIFMIIPFTFNIMENNSIWPNIYLSVSELDKIPLWNKIIYIGITLFFFGVGGTVLTIIRFIRRNLFNQYLKNMNSFILLFLLTWVLASLYLIYIGNRFILIIIPPLVIFAGILTGLLIDCMRNIKNHNVIANILPVIFIIFIILTPVLNPYGNINLKPSVNDDLFTASTWIKYNTPPDTIIISEWSYGYFFQVFADRSVSVDGGSQNTPREYWISKAFSTRNETLSIGIFRMLTSSGDKSWIILDEYTGNTSKSVDILNNILGLNEGDALNLLMHEYNFTKKDSERILNVTHNSISKPFVIVTTDRMVGTGHWNFYFGEWDFNNRKPGNVTYSVGDFKNNKSIITSSNNVKYNLSSDQISWDNKEPYCLIEVKNGIVEKRYIDNLSDFCVILLYDTKEAVVIDKKFTDSVFTKLVLEKKNTSHFKIIYENKKVVVWNVTSC